MKKQKRQFERSPHATLSPMSIDHPSNIEGLRQRPKPRRTPVMRTPFQPHPMLYPAAFRGRS